MSSFWSGFEDGFTGGLGASSGGAVMMSLGSLRFGVRTQEYESLRTSIGWRWAEKSRYLRAPALQFQGPATITKTFDVVVVVEKGSDLEFLPELQALGDTGLPQRLVAGHSRPVGGVNMLAGGSDLGLWCLTELSITEDNFLQDGTAILHRATLTIKSYGEDAL